MSVEQPQWPCLCQWPKEKLEKRKKKILRNEKNIEHFERKEKEKENKFYGQSV